METKDNSLPQFLTAVSENVGFSLGKTKKKGVFNPFAVGNSQAMVTMYLMLKSYSVAEKKPEIPIPQDVLPLKNAGLKFKFSEELDKEALEKILEEKKIENVIVDNEKNITVSKTVKKS